MRFFPVALILLAAFALGAGAQPPDSSTTDTPADVDAGQPAEAEQPPPDLALSNEVQIDVRQIGLRRPRSGGWTVYQIEVLDTSPRSRQVFVRMSIPDPDGDRVVPQRRVFTNPGVKQSVLLYAWHPYDDRECVFGVYEAEEIGGLGIVSDGAAGADGGGGAAGADRYRAGRLLGSRRFSLNNTQRIDPSAGVIAVLGAPTAGLEQYANCRLPAVAGTPTAHEPTEVISNLKPDDIPDRWAGLSAFEALVWTGREPDEQPARLREGQYEAIKEWVRRGGHFIVVVPSIGQTWLRTGGATAPITSTNPLADIMPDVRAVQVEGADFESYRQLLTSNVLAPMPKNAVVHRLEPAAGSTPGPYDAMPIMRGIANDVVVSRRLVGAGAVTVIGLDLARRDLQAIGSLQAGQFWNLILGKRMKVFSPLELNNFRSGGSQQNAVPLFNASRDGHVVDFDTNITSVIAKQGKAAKGLLTAFGIFLLYWLLAGPIGYYLLRQRKRVQHAWVGFVAVTAMFTLIGWGSASALKLGRDVDKHYTLLDHVYGQSNQRMRTWVELTLPKYGEQTVSVLGPGENTNPGAPAGWHHLITAWESGNERSSAVRSFPDARPYFVDTRSPDTIEFPARATTRQLQIDYAGAAPSNWGMPRPIAADGVELGREIYIEEPPPNAPASAERRWKIQGKLVHDLPSPIRAGYVFLVREPRIRGGAASAPAIIPLLPAEVYSGKLPDAWAAGEAIDLQTIIDTTSRRTDAFFLDIRGKAAAFGASMGAAGLSPISISLERTAYGQAFFPMLEPPDPAASSEVLARRTASHGWDLGRWFTQPCVIIIGIVGGESASDAAECPVPISVDGSSPESTRKIIKGVTVVRWIYPLTPRPVTAESRLPLIDDAAPSAPTGDRKPS